MLRSLSVAVLAAVALVPVGASSASAAEGTAVSPRATAPMASAVWKNSATRRGPRTPAPVPVVQAPRTPVAAPAPAPVPAPVAPAPAPAVSAAQAYQDRVLVLTNAERAKAGLAALRASGCADGYADRWAGSLLAAGALSHQALSPILSACGARGVGENVAYGNVSPEQLVAMWMGSPGHRANILNATFTHLGVGATSTSGGRWYGVQVFLRA